MGLPTSIIRKVILIQISNQNNILFCVYLEFSKDLSGERFKKEENVERSCPKEIDIKCLNKLAIVHKRM